MRLFNWRRQAVLNAMPLVKPDQVRTPWHEFWRRFRRQHMAMTAALFVILLIVVAIFARWIAPYDAENYFDLPQSIKYRTMRRSGVMTI
ncbi:hypothetical protein EIMP300_67460 [Escherichia coli]|uniref:Oligopeptide transport permease C-like N-terminal domain-containing protein n=1 Tax=Escherichia coli TaxID=562 RepID=A0A8S0FY82_ECOLX|nr:hypothetical protein EIMP300_67460 [Escherichia coli]